MRLLTFNSQYELNLAEFTGDRIPQYAILSHTWGQGDEEVAFKDLIDVMKWKFARHLGMFGMEVKSSFPHDTGVFKQSPSQLYHLVSHILPSLTSPPNRHLVVGSAFQAYFSLQHFH
jgi:hypothetical protein